MRKAILAAALASLSAISSAAADPVFSVQNLGTTATHGAQSCPATIKFTFLMRVIPAASIPVTYRFVRSDGGTTPAYNAVLGASPPGGPGYSPTQYAWQLSGTPKYSGWVKVEMLTPQQVTSAPENFTLLCSSVPMKHH